MNLTFEQIKSITVGAVSIDKKDNGIIEFKKCTERQIQAWNDFGSSELCFRAKTTTGIRLDFYTNSKSFSFKAGGGCKFEILVDGKIRERLVFDGEKNIETSIKITDALGKEKEESRVTLVFPSHSIGELEYVAIDDGAYIRRPEYKHKILFIGDSITQGWNSYFDSLSYAWRVTRYFDAESVINGIGGAFYQPETFEKIDFDPELIILAYGTNDACRFDYDGMKDRTTKYLDLIKENYPDKKVVALSPIWRAKADGKTMGEDFEKKRLMVEQEAAARDFYVVPGLELVDSRAELFADTYLHPNDLGFGVYAENLIKKLADII